MSEEERKARHRKEFIHALAVYLVGNEAAKGMSINFESAGTMVRWASEWATVRSWSPIRGYTTIEEAEKQLTDYFNQFNQPPVADGNSKPTAS